MRGSLIRFLSASIATVLICVTLTVPASAQEEPVKWTVMIYMDGDNSLEPFTFMDIDEMERVDQSLDVTITTLHDARTAFTGTHWYVIDDGDDHIDSETGDITCDCSLFCNPGEEHLERNMGDGATLTEFIVKSVTYAPADRYVLVMWDHGMGWVYLCVDETDYDGSKMARMSPHEVRTAMLTAREELKASYIDDEFTLSILGYDACMSSMIEVAYEDRGLAEYIVASVNNVPGTGWDYYPFLARIVDDTSTDPVAICTTIVDSYVEFYSTTSELGYGMANMIGMSVLDVSTMETAVGFVDVLTEELVLDGYAEDPAYTGALRSAMYDTPWVVSLGQTQPFIDIGNYIAALGDKIPELHGMCENAFGAIDEAVVYVNSCNATYGGDMGTSGLAAYFPQGWSSVYPMYAYEDAEEAALYGEYILYGLDFCSETYWDELIFLLFEPYDEGLLDL